MECGEAVFWENDRQGTRTAMVRPRLRCGPSSVQWQGQVGKRGMVMKSQMGQYETPHAGKYCGLAMERNPDE